MNQKRRRKNEAFCWRELKVSADSVPIDLTIYSPGKDRDGKVCRSRSSATSHDKLMASTPPPLLASDTALPTDVVTPCSIGFSN